MKPIRQILEDAATIAVVGLSPKPERASLAVATYLQAQGYRIVPINPSYAGQQILGEKVYPKADMASAAGLDVVMNLCMKIEHARMLSTTEQT